MWGRILATCMYCWLALSRDGGFGFSCWHVGGGGQPWLTPESGWGWDSRGHEQSLLLWTRTWAEFVYFQLRHAVGVRTRTRPQEHKRSEAKAAFSTIGPLAPCRRTLKHHHVQAEHLCCSTLPLLEGGTWQGPTQREHATAPHGMPSTYLGAPLPSSPPTTARREPEARTLLRA